MKRQTFVVIGLGLIGGSLAAALKQCFPKARVVGVSRKPSKIRFARKRRLIHEGHTQLSRAVQRADLIFICTPVHTIPKLVVRADCLARPGTIVTDVGSTKSSIVREIDRMSLKRVRFVGSHPLAGSHLTGPEHAKADLFKRAHVFVTPSRKTSAAAKRLVSSVWKRLGARVKVLSPQAHDQITSQVSHLPHAIATCLVQSVSQKALRFSSTGFLDTTRVAQGDPSIWQPIFLSNRRLVARDVKLFQKTLQTFLKVIERGNGASLKRMLIGASAKRGRIRQSR